MNRLTATLAAAILALAILPSVAVAAQAAIAPLVSLLFLVLIARLAMPPRSRSRR